MRSAHKWGGDGRKPSFRKIRRVLLSRHPEVIARAFGGNPDVAAAWIKNNWYYMRGKKPPPTRGKRKAVHAMDSETDLVRVLTEEEETAIVEMGVSDVLTLASPSSEDDGEGHIVKTLLRTGEWKYWPNGVKKDLKIDKAFLEDVVKAFKANVVPHVTIPFNSHDDGDLSKNVGFVRDVWIERSKRKKDRWLLKGSLEITEPEVKAKVERGTYPDVSVFVDLRGTRDPETEKVWPRVLKHATITHRPFVSQMNDKKLAATENDENVGLRTWELEIDDEVQNDLVSMFESVVAKEGDVSYDESKDWDEIRNKINSVLQSPEYRQYPDGATMPPEAYVMLWKMNDERALIRVHTGYSSGEEPRHFVAGWELSSGSPVIDPPDEWIEVHQRWIQATQEDAWSAVFTDEHDNPEHAEGGTPVAAQSGETTGGGSPQGGTLTMTQEELDARLAQEREARDEELKQLKAQIEASEERDRKMREQLHRASVKELIAKWEDKKVPPAVIVEAKSAIEPMESGGEPILKMTATEGEGESAKTIELDLNLMAVVDRIVCSIPGAQDSGERITRLGEIDPESSGAGTRFTAISGGTSAEDKKKLAEEQESELGLAPVKSA